MNIYNHIDREKLQFDFLGNHNGSIVTADEIEKLGGKMYFEIYPKRESILKHHQSLDNFFKTHAHEYNAIHMHMNFIRYYAPLKYAQKYEVPIRIYHSHNSADMYNSKSLISKITEYDARKNVGKYATNLFACSELAGKYMFDEKPFKIINNAIDTDKYIFNEEMRAQKRRELNLGDSFVIGSVGRLQYQKNPEFIIEIFNEVLKQNPNSKLVMVGEGVLENTIREMIKKFGIQDKVKMLGRRYDVPELMQAFDCFLLPSRFEGLPLILVEAQSAGLPCFISDSITKEVKITDLIYDILLNKGAAFWSQELLSSMNIKRTERKSEIVSAGFDIKEVANEMQKFYLGE